MTSWQTRLASVYRPDTLVIGVPAGARGLPAALDKPASATGGDVSAWLCQGVTCLPPVANLPELERLLDSRAARALKRRVQASGMSRFWVRMRGVF